ncbi:MAG: cryptochrome/photolyase family protein [Rhodospirillales bacterium]
MTDTGPIIVWFRQDLRLADNPALHAAVGSGRPVVPLYILDDETPGDWKPGGAARWWLHHSLEALSEALAGFETALVLRHGPAADTLSDVIDETGAGGVYWNRCYEPYAIARDKAVKRDLKDRGLDVRSFNGSLLFEPWTIETRQGGFYKVYTRFWHACREKGDPEKPLPAPDKIEAFGKKVTSDDLGDWELLPTGPDWAGGLRARWQPGEAGASARLRSFLDEGLDGYKDRRDFPADTVTSNLSPFLHIGDIGPRQVWHETVEAVGWTEASEKFLKELVWREFAYHVFYHLPDLPVAPMYAKFRDFPWQDDGGNLACWQQGMTGYPMVDAGMRELWRTGHMHNRVRMVTASFLVKHLLLPWQAGEAWFWDTLVDADLAVNAFSWQWVAGCGADAAPYFRIFNPIVQGSKFDPKGDYIRMYVPEIAKLPDKYLFAPWEAPDDVLHDAGIELGRTYPKPVVDHKRARERALAAFKSLPQNENA